MSPVLLSRVSGGQGVASLASFKRNLGSGVVSGEYVEDLFSTYLYTGAGSTQTITNGIDLSGEGGLVWLKRKIGSGYSHLLVDTVRGSDKALSTNSGGTEQSGPYYAGNFSSTGFDVVGGDGGNNGLGNFYVSWTFRKAPGFFDVVTYTGNGTAGRTVSHNLGSVPGVIIVKGVDFIDNWAVYHRSLGATKYMMLDQDNGAATLTSHWNDTAPTASVFTLGDAARTNDNGKTYVAYLFAHDEAVFGENADQSVIKCGSFTTDGSGNATVNLGWEPQWLLYKRTDGVGGNWYIIDNMRGFALGTDRYLQPNTFNAEGGTSHADPTATGFTASIDTSATYIYIAIRRGPMKTPTDATTVFATNTRTGNGGTATVSGINFSPDSVWIKNRADFASSEHTWFDKLRGVNQKLGSDQTSQELDYTPNYLSAFNQDGFTVGSGSLVNYSAKTYVDWMFRRAPGFFDVVTYTGTGSATTVSHNLGVAPELMIVKSRSNSDDWIVYHSSVAIQNILKLQSTAAATDFGSPGAWNNTAPTASVFTVSGTGWSVNNSSQTYIAYLFATCSGVSKVGSYTGTGSNINVDCGFTSGARFVLIKRTDTAITGQTPPTGYNTDWYVWDTARGIVAGNDPYLRLNTDEPEDTGTDFIDPYSAGFTVTSSAPAALNASGGSYIFLAIA